MNRQHLPAHPGAVLREYLPENLSVAEAAKRLGVTRQALSALINGRAGVSAAMALRLEAALGTSAEMWLGMQTNFDLWQARKRKSPKVARIAAGLKAAWAMEMTLKQMLRTLPPAQRRAVERRAASLIAEELSRRDPRPATRKKEHA